MIDLSTCVPGQLVKYLCGKYGKYICPTGGDFPRFITETFYDNRFYHTQSGSVPNGGCSHPYDVIKILPVEPTPTPQETDYKSAYIEIANIISVAFPECEVTTVDMARLIMNENRALRMALGLPSYKQVSDAIDEEEVE